MTEINNVSEFFSTCYSVTEMTIVYLAKVCDENVISEEGMVELHSRTLSVVENIQQCSTFPPYYLH